MKFATITATRGDRPKLLDFCKHQLSRMERKPDKSYFIEMPPIDDDFDLVARVRAGLHLAAQDGFPFVFIIEDDDYYPKTYFNDVPDVDFIGEYETTYYTLVYKQYQTWGHHNHSSLFTSGFKISALDKFNWPPADAKFLDLDLWKFANRTRKNIYTRKTGAIGMKHGIGLCGGKGHVQRMKYEDRHFEWLKANVDQEAFEFYRQLL